MHTLAFEIDYKNEKAGWIHCWLVVDGRRHTLDASNVFPPFQPLLRFVKAVAGQRLPAKFYWDEEGVGADFEATAIAEDSPFMHLMIKHADEATPWIDADIEREIFIRAFLPPILDFSKNFLLAEKEWYLSRELVAKFQHAIVTGIRPRTDIHSPQVVECVVHGDYDVEYIEGRVFIQIKFEDETVVSILLFDTNPIWGQIVDFFGQIASADLPAMCEHIRVIHLPVIFPAPPSEYQVVTRLMAEPLDVPQNFRLKIFTKHGQEADFLLFDEVVDRQQFAHGFAASLKQFLKKEYRVIPDKDGNTFDLRTLSLDKLEQA